jgi:hypothetical protein
MLLYNNGTDVIVAFNRVVGNVVGNLTGTASNATVLQTARTIALQDGVTGTATSFNGSANISIPVTAINASVISTGTINNARTTASSSNGASTIVARDASGNFTTNTVTGNLTGTASNATALQTARTIQGVSFNGTANITVVTAGTGITVAGTAVSIPQAVGTTSSVQFGSFGVGTAASGTTGEIRATNNVTAFFSSDRKFKENIRDIDGALEKVTAIGGKYFDWTDDYVKKHGGEDGYFVTKSDFGVIAQDVQAVFPVAVKTREDGSLAVDYEKLCVLSFAAIKELKSRVEKLEG